MKFNKTADEDGIYVEIQDLGRGTILNILDKLSIDVLKKKKVIVGIIYRLFSTYGLVSEHDSGQRSIYLRIILIKKLAEHNILLHLVLIYVC